MTAAVDALAQNAIDTRSHEIEIDSIAAQQWTQGVIEMVVVIEIDIEHKLCAKANDLNHFIESIS